MDNSFSQPSLVTPTVPDNADAASGTTKRDLIVYIMSLLQGAQITGITQSEPNPLDITQLATDLAALEDRVEVTEVLTTQLNIVLTGVTDGTQVVSFSEDFGTSDYTVDATIISSQATNYGIWALVPTFKASTGFRIKFSGMGGAADVEITVRKNGD